MTLFKNLEKEINKLKYKCLISQGIYLALSLERIRINSLIRNYSKYLSTLVTQYNILKSNINKIRNRKLYKILKLLEPIIGSIWIVKKSYDLEKKLQNMKLNIEIYKRSISNYKNELKKTEEVMNNVKNILKRDITEIFIIESLFSFKKLIINIIERIESWQRTIEGVLLEPDLRLRNICVYEKIFHDKLFKQYLILLNKISISYPWLLIYAQTLLDELDRINNILEDLKKKSETYFKIYTYPEISEAIFRIASKAYENLYIISPYISPSILENVLKSVKKHVKVKIIIKRKEDYEKAKNVAKAYGNASVKLAPLLHCKIMCNDTETLITSANLSKQGLEEWHEIGILTNELGILNNVKNFFFAFWNEKPYIYKEESIKNLNEINDSILFVSTCSNLPEPLLKILLEETKESVVIVTPYMTSNVIEWILNKIRENVKINAIIRVDRNDWLNDLSDPKSIIQLEERCQTIWNNYKLHAKILLFDNRYALLSSMNLTQEALYENHEAGLFISNKSFIEVLLKEIEKFKLKIFDFEEFRRENKLFIKELAIQKKPPVKEEVMRVVDQIKIYPTRVKPKDFCIEYKEKTEKLKSIHKKVESEERIVKSAKSPPIDLVTIELAIIVGLLICGGYECTIEELIKVIEKNIIPKFPYFPTFLMSPESLKGRKWCDSQVLETCFRFLESRGWTSWIIGINTPIKVSIKQNKISLIAKSINELVMKFKPLLKDVLTSPIN